jgi:hypothetical protein
MRIVEEAIGYWALTKWAQVAGSDRNAKVRQSCILGLRSIEHLPQKLPVLLFVRDLEPYQVMPIPGRGGRIHLQAQKRHRRRVG